MVVADDSPEFLAWLWSALEKADDFAPVGRAATGAMAIELIARLTPDVAVVDIDMPEPDGLDVARWVQQQGLATRVVVVTAHADRAFATLAAESGASAFIPKAVLSADALRGALDLDSQSRHHSENSVPGFADGPTMRRVARPVSDGGTVRPS